MVSPDGKAQRLLRKSPPPSFGFSEDGARIYLVRRAPTRVWELAAIRVGDGVETKISDLNLPPDVGVEGFSLHPDGKRFATAIVTLKRDIWILEGLRQPAGWLGWLRRQ